MKQTCILILGMHRSGTSALSGVLGELDVYLGSDLMAPKAQNAKGFFENNIIYKENEKLLHKMQSHAQDDFFNESKLCQVHETKELEHALLNEFKYSNVFAIKDPRIGFLLPIYIKILNKLNIQIKIIIPVRNPLEVAHSLNKRDQFSIEKGLLHWAYHILLTEKFSRDITRVFTSFDDLIQDPASVVKLIDKKLDLNLTSKYQLKKAQVKKFLAPDLKHHNITQENLSEKTPKIIRDILNLVPKLNDSDKSEQLDTLRNQLFDHQKLFYNENIINSLDDLEASKHKLQVQDDELSVIKQKSQATQSELEHTQQVLQTIQNELVHSQQALQATQDQLQHSQQTLQATEGELEHNRHILQMTQSDLENNIKEHERIKHELILMHVSRSWKITRPLRKITKITGL